jgi:RHS repeat-associated protein
VTDPNNQTTSFSYDSLLRPSITNFPDGGQTTLCYTDTGGATCTQAAAPFKVVTTQKLTTTLNATSTQVLDSLGRTSQTQLTSDPDGVTYVDTTYDALGRQATVSNPYRTSNDPGPTNGVTTSNYDALGRVTKLIPPDGTGSTDNLTTAYAGNCTTVTDEANKIRKSCTDGLNRLTQVFEPDSSNNLVNETDYQYDALNNLLTVNQKGNTTDSTKWRARTFTYNSLSQLLTATNPESGTITHTYDSDGNVQTKLDARSDTTTDAYDALNRLTGKTYSNGDPAISYFYDQTSYNGLTITNGIGRRTGMTDAAGSEAWSYDAMGRALTDQRKTNAVTKSTVYRYNLDGSVATLAYPSGRIITYTPNAAGRTISAVDSTGPINYATAAHYAPQGALTSLTNGANLSSTYLYNSRLQPCWTYATTGTALPSSVNCTTPDPGPGNVLDLQYNFSLGVADNGNVMGITNNRDTTRSQNFSYDALNRIATAYTSGNLWGETFQIDPWSNLNKILAYSGKPQPENLNQMAGNNNRFTGMSYDAAGNLLNDGASTYFYDAESRIQTGAGVTYTYDGDGRRVQKSSGKLYWYGVGSDPLDETDAAGNTNNTSFNEYIFFNGKRIARRDSSSNVFYYFADHLGTSRDIVQAGQSSPCYDADFYPFGGERVITNTCPQNYKFTGKERDAESGLDYFGARYDSSQLGRFISPDSLGILTGQTGDPQGLNLYSYVQNNPINAVDPDGLDCVYVGGDSVSVKRGDCVSDTDNGIFVNGTVDIHSGTYDSSTGTVGFNYTNDDTGAIGKGVIGNVYPSGGVSDADRFNAVLQGMQMATPGVNLAANGLRAFGYAVAAPLMVAAECAAGAESCTKGNVAMAILPEIGALREGALILKEGAAVGKGAEILQKGGGMAQAAKDFESLQGAEKVYGSTKVKELADGTKAVLYESKGSGATLALQDAAGRTVTKIRY